VDVRFLTGQIALRTALERVFGHQFLVAYDVKTKRLGVAVITGEKTSKNLYSKVISDDASVEQIVNDLLASLAKRSELAVRVNKNLINRTVMLNGQRVNYNAIIGASAHSNIAVPHTVNDWFTIAPLDSTGKT